MRRFYAGIGSRKNPLSVQEKMTEIAETLEVEGFALRSGGAKGADRAFQRGVKNSDNMEIFIPWEGFEGLDSSQPGIFLPEFDLELLDIARSFHPRWGTLSPAAKKLHARNVPQILGRDLKTPVEFAILWTPDGKIRGGTGQAMRICNHLKIKIFNLHNENFNPILF